MTDNDEILKALECCSYGSEFKCQECPADDCSLSCGNKLAKHTLDLINRQKAEIERLEARHREMCIGMKVLKRNARKEFAERLREKVEKARRKYQRLCKEQGEKEDEVMNIHFNGMSVLINNLLEEMEG